MQVKLPDGRALPVRRLTAADAAAVRRFGDELGPASSRLFLPHRYDPATLRRLLDRAEAGEDLVLGVFDPQSPADDGPRLVGYFFLWYFTRPVPLLGIGLLDAYQDRGLGRQMLGLLLDAAREAGREGVELTTALDNDRAFALYQKVGFRYLGHAGVVAGDGRILTERHLLYEIAPGARPTGGPHGPPV